MNKITREQLVEILDRVCYEDECQYHDMDKAVDFLINFGLINKDLIEPVKAPELKANKQK